MKEIFDYSFFFKNELATKFHYTGYVVTPGFEMNGQSSHENQKGLISTGGGQDGQKLLTLFLNYLDSFSHRNISWTIIIGNYFPDQDKIEISLKKYPNISIKKNVIIEGELLKNYSIHICMAGYNTLVENISMGIKPIVYARTTSGEQKLRGAIFEKNLLCHVITYDISAIDLDKLINMEITTPLIPNFKVNLNGASTTRDLIANLV
jgi:predicted glycosyltransferase